MAQINKPNTQFNTVLYTGNGGTQSITGVNFQPDLVWVKSRSNPEPHMWTDVVRGTDKNLRSNLTDAEYTSSTNITSFDSDGFSLGVGGAVNENTYTFTSWNWKAGGTAVSNTDGTIASSVSANTTAGFSIVSFTNSGSGNRTVGHGLNAKPKMIIQHAINDATNWLVYHENLNSSPENYYLYLNTTNASQTITNIWGAGMTTTTFGINAGVGGTTSYINYCFAEKKGFSKFGSYTGNGSTDGTFVYTGFRPSFILVKNTQTTVNSWEIHDNKRDTFNVGTKRLYPNANASEGSGTWVDMLSNGFKWRSTDGGHNSANTFIYACFAENPLVGTNNIPTTAR